MKTINWSCYYSHGKDVHRFGITIRTNSDSNIKVSICTIDKYDFAENTDDLNNGDEFSNPDYMELVGNEIITIDIWAKYYFPTFNNQENQWWHIEQDSDSCYMEMMYRVMKFAYDKAMSVTNLKTY